VSLSTSLSRLTGAGNLGGVEFTELPFQVSARAPEVHINFEAWLLLEVFDDPFKADRGDLFVRSPKVHEHGNLCAPYQGLLQLQFGSADPNVVEHSWDFRFVISSIG